MLRLSGGGFIGVFIIIVILFVFCEGRYRVSFFVCCLVEIRSLRYIRVFLGEGKNFVLVFGGGNKVYNFLFICF